ncbi:Hypothetical_protein [Hexamita inflata]|uniref:Hypothetical_protein n=1 Tax=Hexamita inflata TaxID=28002 RepID=A0AA86TKN0_9EUKA|nr:Hypothetical protein HINF_LOCUS3423 [Hexamita inflata]
MNTSERLCTSFRHSTETNLLFCRSRYFSYFSALIQCSLLILLLLSTSLVSFVSSWISITSSSKLSLSSRLVIWVICSSPRIFYSPELFTFKLQTSTGTTSKETFLHQEIESSFVTPIKSENLRFRTY